jgi:hypothetical protein
MRYSLCPERSKHVGKAFPLQRKFSCGREKIPMRMKIFFHEDENKFSSG